MAKKPNLKSFDAIIREAINDITENGADSAERILFWQEQLERAARAALIPESDMQQYLREALAAAYRSDVEKGGLIRRHPGIGKFTIERLKPKLRSELNKRVLMSFDLVKLNREKVITDLKSTFSGWASSIPPGGSDSQNKREEKEKLRKGMAGMSFRDRRVIIDQVHKLNANINDVIAVDGGAIAVIWKSHYHQSGYDYREDHKEREIESTKTPYLIRGSWADEQGLVKGSKYIQDMTQFGEEVFCFPGSTQIQFADGVEVVFRRWYEGAIVSVHTATGRKVDCTPNHPILTQRGWVAANLLDKGDYLVEMMGIRSELSKEYANSRVSIFSEIFKATFEIGQLVVRRGKFDDFHGDGTDSNIDIVLSARELVIGADTFQSSEQFNLPYSNSFTSGFGTIKKFVADCFSTCSSFMSSFSNSLTFLFTNSFHSNKVCLGAVSQRDISFDQSLLYPTSGTIETNGNVKKTSSLLIGFYHRCRINLRKSIALFGNSFSHFTKSTEQTAFGPTQGKRDFGERFPFATQFAEITEIKKSSFSGHVYNLQTKNGWYVADGVIVHNCRCYGKYLYNLGSLPESMLTRKGKERLAEARRKMNGLS